MSAQDRKRKSAPQNKVKSFISAATAIEPSEILDQPEYERFQAIIASRERDSWTPADIATAGYLAKVELQRDAEFARYKEDGNWDKVCDVLFAQSNRMRRDLGLSASQRGISGHKQAKRNQQDQKAAEKVSSLSSLIAKPRGN